MYTVHWGVVSEHTGARGRKTKGNIYMIKKGSKGKCVYSDGFVLNFVITILLLYTDLHGSQAGNSPKKARLPPQSIIHNYVHVDY